MSNSPEQLLAQAIEDQRAEMRGYEIPSEALTFEVVRALDHAFCRELFPHLPPLKNSERLQHFYLQRGVNDALSRVLPNNLSDARPRLFPSTRATREKADGFLLSAGLLWLANRLHTQLRAGFLQGHLDPHRKVRGMPILVLTVADETLYNEQIGRASVDWLSDRALLVGRPREEELMREREVMLPRLTERLLRLMDTGESNYADDDPHFHACAEVYLSRMPYRDLLSENDRIGGRPYSDYVKALTALSMMSESRQCMASILDSKRPQVGIRNILTGAIFADELIEALATFLDADLAEANNLLTHLTLSPVNREHHLDRATPAWAPLIQTSSNFCLLPCYGLDMNPFIFLMTELRERYKSDWFEAANAREARWIAELHHYFPSPRWLCANGVNIKRGGKLVTDIDFVAYDMTSKKVALFQLKWQQPSLADEKSRRSNASNLIGDSNKWVAAVSDWLESDGLNVLAKRLGVRAEHLAGASLFVMGRYGAHFSGHSNADKRAAWSGWGHLERERTLHPAASVDEMHTNLKDAVRAAKHEIEPESLTLLLPGLSIIVNPTKRPKDMKADAS